MPEPLGLPKLPTAPELLCPALAPGLTVVSAAQPMCSLFPQANTGQGPQRCSGITRIEALCPPQAKPLPSLSLPVSSTVLGCMGCLGELGPLTCPVPGWETSCPPLSSTRGDSASASSAGQGEALPGALPPCTGRLGLWGEQGGGGTLLLPVPALLRPSLRSRQECMAGTARLPLPAQIPPLHPAAGATQTSKALGALRRHGGTGVLGGAGVRRGR